jgi:hypothetical protein
MSNPENENDSVLLSKPQKGFAEIRRDVITEHRALHVKQNFLKGAVISNFEANEIYEKPNYLTVQINDNEHISLLPTYLECINHSCNPNVFFDITHMQLVAIQDIRAGEELTFFYPSTEWEMDQSFNCFCGNKNCLNMIQGANFLNKNILMSYRLTDFILQKINPS